MHIGYGNISENQSKASRHSLGSYRRFVARTLLEFIGYNGLVAALQRGQPGF